ncbi:hypothetical protein PCE1_004793 [Barthelona sp. PCE]
MNPMDARRSCDKFTLLILCLLTFFSFLGVYSSWKNDDWVKSQGTVTELLIREASSYKMYVVSLSITRSSTEPLVIVNAEAIPNKYSSQQTQYASTWALNSQHTFYYDSQTLAVTINEPSSTISTISFIICLLCLITFYAFVYRPRRRSGAYDILAGGRATAVVAGPNPWAGRSARATARTSASAANTIHFETV